MSLDPVNVFMGESVLMIHARLGNDALETGLKPLSTLPSTIRFTLNDNPLSELAYGDGNVLYDAKLSVEDAGTHGEMGKWQNGDNGFVNVYPNPALDILNLEITMLMDDLVQFDFANIHGVSVMKSDHGMIGKGLHKKQLKLGTPSGRRDPDGVPSP